MTHGAVPAQVKVEIIVRLVQSKLLHPALQKLQLILTLASANDLSDAGHQAVHGRHRLSILVELHVKSLDLLRVICHKHRPLKFLLRQESLMLRLQVAAPGHLILKFLVVLFQNFDGLGVGHMSEIRICHMLKPFNQSLIHKLVEESHLLRRMLQHITDHVL